MIESLLFIITLFKDIVKTFFAFATKNIVQSSMMGDTFLKKNMM